MRLRRTLLIVGISLGILLVGCADRMVTLRYQPSRYRFTLAHELGHIVLHGDALKAVAPESILDWKKFVRELPEPDRGWLEWQAYSFAGLVLVSMDKPFTVVALERTVRAALDYHKRVRWPRRQ